MKLFDKFFKKKVTKKTVQKITLEEKPKVVVKDESKAEDIVEQPTLINKEEARFLEAFGNKRTRTTYQLRNQGFANPLAIAEGLQAKGVKLRIETFNKEEKLIIIGGE